MIGEIGQLFIKSLKRQPTREEIGVSFNYFVRHNSTDYQYYL